MQIKHYLVGILVKLKLKPWDIHIETVQNSFYNINISTLYSGGFLRSGASMVCDTVRGMR